MSPRRTAQAAALLAVVLTAGGCSGPSVITTSGSPSLPVGAPTDTPDPVYDVHLRQVLDVANAQAGQCPEAAPPTPDPESAATLCSADRTLVYRLATAAVAGPEVTDVSAVYSSARPVVRIVVTPQGGAALVRLTTDASQASPPLNQVALVSKGRVQAALPATETIDGQVLEITGFDSLQAAQAAAALLLPSASPSPSGASASPS